MKKLLLVISPLLIFYAINGFGAPPLPLPPNVDISVYDVASVMDINNGGSKMHMTRMLRGFAAPNSPICAGSTACPVVMVSQDIIDTSTSIGTAQGTISVVQDLPVPLPPSVTTGLAPNLEVVSYQFSAKTNASSNPATVSGNIIGNGLSLKFTGYGYIPLSANAFGGACPSAFCYGTVNGIVSIGSDQQLFGYNSARADFTFSP